MDEMLAGRFEPLQSQREQLAKDWLVRMIEGTPLPEIGDLGVSRLADDAPELITAVLGALSGSEIDAFAGPRRGDAARLARLRAGPDAAEQIPRDLGALQSVLVEALRRELPEHQPDFARAVERLALVFGSIQGAVNRELVAGRAIATGDDPVTGFPGPAQLDERLRILLAERRRYGQSFALALVDVDGLARINDAYGREAGDRMLAAVAAILRRQLRDADQAFRLEEDEFAIVAPRTNAVGLAATASRIATLIADSQSADGPRIAIASGVVDCPGDGTDAERLLESATEATYAAKAAGTTVARSPNAPPLLQDP